MDEYPLETGDGNQMFEDEEDAGTEVEEDYHTDEEIDKRQYGIYQALPVDDAEPDWESGEPETVEEYLRRVRHEARHLPSVVTSSVDPRRFDDQQTPGYGGIDDRQTPQTDCPEELKPSVLWLRQFLAAFVALRQRLQREHELSTGQVSGLPLRIAFPHPSTAATTLEEQDLLSNPPSSLMPELETLKRLDQVSIVQRLQRTIAATVGSDALTPESAAQIYALSARLERPLHADTAAAYRALLRRCKQWRKESEGTRDPLLPHMNILIALSGAFFRQDEELSAVWNQDEDDVVL